MLCHSTIESGSTVALSYLTRVLSISDPIREPRDESLRWPEVEDPAVHTRLSCLSFRLVSVQHLNKATLLSNLHPAVYVLGLY